MYGLVTIPELSTGENYMTVYLSRLSCCFFVVFFVVMQ